MTVFFDFETLCDINQHAAVSCICRDGFSLNETSMVCQRWDFPEFTTPTPSGIVKTVETEVGENGGKLRLVNEGICQDPMSGRVEIFLNDISHSCEKPKCRVHRFAP